MTKQKEERAYLTCIVAHEAQEVAHNTYELKLEKPSSNFSFLPGQSMKFCVEDLTKEDGSTRQPSFTIASAPHEEHLIFVFRGSQSPLKQYLLGLRKGQEVPMRDVLRGTVDRAVYPESPHIPAVFFVCGVGITPFRSMIMHAAHIHDSRPFVLLYANPTVRDIAYKEMIDECAQSSKVNLTCQYFLTKEICDGYEHGYFNEVQVQSIVDTLDSLPLLYVVGPPAMVSHVESLLINTCGVGEEYIRTKKYTGYEGRDDTIPE